LAVRAAGRYPIQRGGRYAEAVGLDGGSAGLAAAIPRPSGYLVRLKLGSLVAHISRRPLVSHYVDQRFALDLGHEQALLFSPSASGSSSSQIPLTALYFVI
jgi:hypothetical protein